MAKRRVSIESPGSLMGPVSPGTALRAFVEASQRPARKKIVPPPLISPALSDIVDCADLIPVPLTTTTIGFGTTDCESNYAPSLDRCVRTLDLESYPLDDDDQSFLSRKSSIRSMSRVVERRPSLKWSEIMSRHNTMEEFSSDGSDCQTPVRRHISRTLSLATSVADLEYQATQKDLSPCCTPRNVARPRPGESPPATYRGRGRGDVVNLFSDGVDSRFDREFAGQRKKIGEGHFSDVFKAISAEDGCMYAIKRTKNRIVSADQAPNASLVKEVYALESVAKEAVACHNIVRYYSSWFEDGQLYIQMELCNGSLRDYLENLCDENIDPRCTAAEIKEVVTQVATGLQAMHRSNFVHLDVKPDNIMSSRDPNAKGRWKVGDLGLAVIALGCGCDDVSEGDCRYLAREVLKGDLKQLDRADVFSLGVMAYEMGTSPQPLPGSGEEWHVLRDGYLDRDLLPEMSPTLFDLLVSLVHPEPAKRPSCEEILSNPAVSFNDAASTFTRPATEKRHSQIVKELRFATEPEEDEAPSIDVAPVPCNLLSFQDGANNCKSKAETFKRQALADPTVVRPFERQNYFSALIDNYYKSCDALLTRLLPRRSAP